MKRRINIWDTKKPNSNKKSKTSHQGNSDSHYHSVNNENGTSRKPVQSTFEYEQITPTEAEFYSEIEHEDGD